MQLQGPLHPDRSADLDNLGNALKRRFIQSGGQDDLDEAISLYRDALELRPAPHCRRSPSTILPLRSTHDLTNQVRREDKMPFGIGFNEDPGNPWQARGSSVQVSLVKYVLLPPPHRSL